MVEDLDDKLDAYTVGTNIAQANNDTQNVKADDIFGNKNKNELNRYIFKDFIEEYSSKIQIEYKYGEVDEKKHKKIHILPLLRLIIPTEILTKETDIYKFTNQRLPIYNIFSKLFNQIKKNNEKAIRAAEIISRLVPLLYKIRINYVEPSLFKLRRDLNRYYTKKAYEGDLKKTIIGKDIDEAKGDNAQIEKIANRITRYNIEHVLPVVIYRIRNLFKVNIDGKLALNIPTENTENFIESLTEVIYTRYIEIKLKGVQSSLTTEVRDESFYKLGYECYTSNIRILKINGTDFIEKNKYYIR